MGTSSCGQTLSTVLFMCLTLFEGVYFLWEEQLLSGVKPLSSCLSFYKSYLLLVESLGCEVVLFLCNLSC
jgi:hypothetical protein